MTVPVDDFDPLNFTQLKALVDAARPASFATAADALTDVRSLALEQAQILANLIPLYKAKDVWQGPAAEAFADVLRDIALFIDRSTAPLATNWLTLTINGKDPVLDLQNWFAANASHYVPTAPNAVSWDFDARQLVKQLVRHYGTLMEDLDDPIPATPEDLKPGPSPVNDPTNDPKDEKKPGEDKEKDPKKEEKGEGGGGSGGGSKDDPKTDPGSGSGGSGSGGGSGQDPGSGSGSGSGSGGSGSGSDPTGGSSPPLLSNGSLTDRNRSLSTQARTTGKNGEVGIDVDGDGVPDLGLDGKPLNGVALVEHDGLRGVDVDGDGRPDIGVHGEILKFAPIVQGVDGVIGVDVDGDGKPDVGISGQALADAPIVTRDGVTGIDVNGDGIPDLGFDRRPLPTAELVTFDGLTGVDVDGDGKPDIGVNGEILKFAPIVHTTLGISGVDVNGDGKPDIATLGGQWAPVPLAITFDQLSSPIPLTADQGQAATGAPTVPTSLTSLQMSGTASSAAYFDAPTALAGLGAATSGRDRTESAGPSGAMNSGAMNSAVAGHGGASGVGRAQAGRRGRAAPLEEWDTWNDAHGAPPALGRPDYDTDDGEY
jgi:hypothetical protein